MNADDGQKRWIGRRYRDSRKVGYSIGHADASREGPPANSEPL